MWWGMKFRPGIAMLWPTEGTHPQSQMAVKDRTLRFRLALLSKTLCIPVCEFPVFVCKRYNGRLIHIRWTRFSRQGLISVNQGGQVCAVRTGRTEAAYPAIGSCHAHSPAVQYMPAETSQQIKASFLIAQKCQKLLNCLCCRS